MTALDIIKAEISKPKFSAETIATALQNAGFILLNYGEIPEPETSKGLHEKAMTMAENATVLNHRAFEYEIRAAVKITEPNETKYRLYASAAAIALRAGMRQNARQCAEKAIELDMNSPVAAMRAREVLEYLDKTEELNEY